ncbi:MAG: N-acetylmuramoyl-L-alanine amidase [Thiohalocapsa sp.]
MRNHAATLSAKIIRLASLKALLVLASLVLPDLVLAGQTVVHGARIWNAPDHTRIVIDTAAPIRHRVFALDNPNRLVVDLSDARFDGKLPDADSRDLLVSGLRSGVRGGGDLRVVMDLKQPAKVKSFELQPNGTYGHRLVIDLTPKSLVSSGSGRTAVATAASPSTSKRGKPAPSHLSVKPKGGRQRDVIVAVDAGHGGEDPGAVGRSGTREKDVTLSIAKKLAALINKQRGMKAVLIRDGDYFVALRQRIAKARKHNADLFVSIHADAFKDPSVRGSSVYTLSNGGATSEAAKWLAARENRADLIGGVSLAERNDVLASVLLDMTQNATIEHSSIAATRVLEKLRSLGHVHQTRIQQAGFVVLKSPDIPSMLVETAFISNPDEEKRLRSGGYQNKLASSLLAGILDYFRDYPPPGTRFARQPGERRDDATSNARDHLPGNGETMTQIAQGYNLPLAALRSTSHLDFGDDQVRIGQVLGKPGG